MSESLYFYDLETSGISPREARIMQFAGQRTDLDMNPIGEPHNILIKLTPDILPEPDAILITGITPQKTIAEGVTEAEFLQLFQKDISKPGTIFVGYNTVRFDDEFMRFLHYRNFFDPYEWQWQDGRGRWDLLDVVRMMRALRPEGIQWPFDSNGKPSNRLELLTSLNGIEHENAHDALNDVHAVIALAKKIKMLQPRFFNFLLEIRQKDKVKELVHGGQPFIYTSGKYSSDLQKTTVVASLADHPKRQGTLVFDLRHDPRQYFELSKEQLAEMWQYKKYDDPSPRLPIKTLQYNRCPAIAPLSVLDKNSVERLHIDQKVIEDNFSVLNNPKFIQKVMEALEILDKGQQARLVENTSDVDTRLYDAFFEAKDKKNMTYVRSASPNQLNTSEIIFSDDRLNKLLPLYKARNFSTSLAEDERKQWDDFVRHRLLDGKTRSRAAKFFHRLQELAIQVQNDGQKQYLLQELQLYAESILPVDEY